MNSPCCGWASVVVSTEPTGRGYVVKRRRECPRCGSRWSTDEEPSDQSVRDEITSKMGPRAAKHFRAG